LGALMEPWNVTPRPMKMLFFDVVSFILNPVKVNY